MRNIVLEFIQKQLKRKRASEKSDPLCSTLCDRASPTHPAHTHSSVAASLGPAATEIAAAHTHLPTHTDTRMCVAVASGPVE
eukprot:28617-Eustigmatos_ZCMA.PRE.1